MTSKALEIVTFSRYSKDSAKIFQEFKSTLPSNWRVSHVGSTALGISGKNIVDVLVETNNTNYAKRFFEKRKWSLIIPKKKRKTILFKKKFSPKKIIHVHISKPSSGDALNLKFFVKYLKNNANARLQYVKLKKEAVKQGKTNNDDYNKHKHEFIQSILKKQTTLDLQNKYEDFILHKVIYRTIPQNQLDAYLHKGVNPSVNYYQQKQKAIEQLFRLAEKAQSTYGFTYRVWWSKWVYLDQVLRTTRRDLQNRWIDFTPQLKNAKYYLKHPGGALATTVFELTNELVKQKIFLTKSELNLVRKLNSWARTRRSIENVIIYYPASAPFFQTAKFQYFGGQYKSSPFGSFENFKKAIDLEGYDFYEPYLTGKKLFYLRVQSKVPKKIARKQAD